MADLSGPYCGDSTLPGNCYNLLSDKYLGYVGTIALKESLLLGSEPLNHQHVLMDLGLSILMLPI